MAETALRFDQVSYAVKGAHILEGVSLEFRPDRFNVLLGANGAGKSTLMRIAAGRLAPSAGEVSYSARPLAAWDTGLLARRRAMLSQTVEMAFPLAVEDVVLMGRYPHYRATPSPRDLEIVAQALALVDMAGRRRQPYPTLSGGEKQKTQLARVLAQVWSDNAEGEPRLLFLDEPTTSLDIHYQLHLLETVRDFVKRRCTVVASLHDLNMAFDYGDHFFLLDEGRLVYDGEGPVPRELIERAYRVTAEPGVGGQWRFRP